jgi:Domain of unknown function (DUF4375)
VKTRILPKREAEQNPQSVWNAFIDLLANENYGDLAEVQRAAHLVFWYESEVQNGGHLQYFENRGTNLLAETIEALHVLGAQCQGRILRDASKLLKSGEAKRIQTTEEYRETALEGEFDELDSRFHECPQDLTEHLQKYLTLHQSLFVTTE